jgi:hypothetical protein
MNEDIKKEPEQGTDERKKPNLKRLKYGTMSVVLAIVVIAVVVLLNVIITLLSNRVNLAADLTTTDFYELTATTTDYLDTVTADVNIVVMAEESVLNASGDQYFKQALEMLKNYGKQNSHITVEFVNLTANPQYSSRYSQIYQGNIAEGDVVITSGSRIVVFPFTDMFNIGTNEYYQQVITSSKVEQEVTTAIMYVTNKNPKKVYIMNVTEANVEPISENIAALLGSNGYDIFYWNPNLEPIPADADVLIIDAPLTDFDENTVKTFNDFLENGGKYSKNIVYLTHPGQTEMTNMNSFLYDWGVGVSPGDFLTDLNTANMVSNETVFLIKAFIDSAATDFIAGVPSPELPVIVNTATPIRLVAAGETGNTSVVTLLSTSETSFIYNETVQAEARGNPDYQYAQASYPVMTVSQKGYKSEYEGVGFSNLLVVSSSEMLYSGFTGASYYNNGDYFVSVLNQMTGRSDTVTIIPKTNGDLSFPTSQDAIDNMTVVFYYVLPFSIAIVAAVVLLRRRHK